MEHLTNQTEVPEHDLADWFFLLSMWWMILFGATRLVVGIALLRVIGMPLTSIVYKVIGPETIEDPGDLFLNILQPFLQHSSLTVTYFIAFYCIFWGVIDIFLAINMVKHKLWAFPVTIALIVFFIIYELYRLSHTHSPVLAFLTVFNVFVIWFIWKEYKKLQLLHQGR